MEKVKVKRRPKKTDRVDFKKLFKFQSFSERIAKVRINIFHQVGTSTAPEDHDTFFHEALEKWKELDCTLEFIAFHKEIQSKANSLAQLVFHKNEVIDKLKNFLSVRDTLAYESLLDLLVQLARDLQEEFYPHFQEFFPILVSLCDTKNVELIQCVFTTYAYLFKFLWRLMLKDLNNVFRLYSQLLLQSQKAHIRQFAVESFSFLLRKVQNKDALIEMVFRSLSDTAELCDGIGQLLFELCKGVQKQFHSCCDEIFRLLLEKMGSPYLHHQNVFQAMKKVVELMAEHTRKEFSGCVWTPLLDHLTSLHERWKEEDEGGVCSKESGAPLHIQLGQTLHLVGVMVSWRNGSRINFESKLSQAIQSILKERSLPYDTLNIALHLAASLILVSPDWQVSAEQMLKVICERRTEEDVKLVIGFFQEVASNLDIFVKDILPHCLQYCETVSTKQDSHLILLFLTELCLRCDPKTLDNSTISITPSSSFVLDLSSPVVHDELPMRRILRRSSRRGPQEETLSLVSLLIQLVESGLQTLRAHQPFGRHLEEEEKTWEEDVIKRLWCVLVCLQYTRPLPKKILDDLQELYHLLKEVLSRGQEVQRQEMTKQEVERWKLCCFLFSQSLSTIVYVIRDSDKLCVAVSIESVLTILKLHPSSLPLLISAFHYLYLLSTSEADSSLLSSEQLHQLLPIMLPNLSSPTSAVRLLTLQILCLFNQPPLEGGNESDGAQEREGQSVNILEVCLRAEEIPSAIDTYRDKLLWLQKLKYSPAGFSQLPQVYREVPLRYLVGNLYINFSLVWGPTIELISSYAVEENMKMFWTIFGDALNKVSGILESCPVFVFNQHLEELPKSGSNLWHESISVLFQCQTRLLNGMECRLPDHANHRMLLWRCLAGLSLEMTEPRSRILVPLLLNFFKNEYSFKEDSLREFQDLHSVEDVEEIKEEITERVSREGTEITERVSREGTEITERVSREGTEITGRVSGDGTEITEGVSGDGAEITERVSGDGAEITERVSVKSEMKQKVSRRGPSKQNGSITRKSLTETLLCMLRVFSQFHNPKSFYKQGEVWQLYLKLITHKQSEVQVLAMAGLITFKPPYLLPYKENFDRLLEDTSFREELVNFRVDCEDAVVSSEHREQLLPILIRVLYGRMQRQGGHSTTKAGGAGRKSLVLRFLGGCKGNELTQFMELLTQPFHCVLERDDSEIMKETVDVRHVIPLKKQQGFLNILGQMISMLGPALLPHLYTLLRIVMYLGNSCAQLLEQRSQIQAHFVNALKILRQLTISRVIECLEKFTDYDFCPFYDHFLSAFVWPQLFKMPQENIQSPTLLLRFLFTCTTQPRYWCLLANTCPFHSHSSTSSSSTHPVPPATMNTVSPAAMDTTVSPATMDTVSNTAASSAGVLKYVFDCVSSSKASPKVCACIMEMTVNLLTLGVDEVGTVNMGAAEQEKRGVVIDGEQLVTPYIPRLLEYLNRVIGEGLRSKGRTEKRNLDCEFTVLSRISSFVRDPSESSVLIKVLLPFLSSHSEEYKKHEESILQSICDLVRKAGVVSQFKRPLSKLFVILKSRSSRNKLCEIFHTLSDRNQQWIKTAGILSKLNSWDSRLLDEPDYEKCLEGFAEAKQLLQPSQSQNERLEWSPSLVDTIYPILENSLYFILQSEDMSIRDAAASFVSELIKTISSEDREAFNLFVLTSMVTAVKKGLRSKQEFARHEVISILSDLVQTFSHHSRFCDLSLLSHSDPEADFFLNVKHIQLHRRTRAFRKLAKICFEGSIRETNSLDFVLPLANQVMFRPTANTEQNLLAEAVNVIGAVSRHLSWANYSFLLGHYLRQLTKLRDIQKNLMKVVIVVLDNFHFDLSCITSLDDSNHGELPLSTGSNVEVKKIENPTEDHVGGPEIEVELEEEEEKEMEVEVGEEDKMEVEVVEEENELKKKTLAKRIYCSLVKTILPRLQQVLTKKVEVAGGHKLSHVEQDVDSEVLRVPIAMAMTKLLLALPEEQLHRNLPNLLLKVCLTLKNRSRDVRDVGRSTLVKMATSLGPKYLKYIVKEMKESLNRGYMLHVLSYSLHYLLQALSTPLATPSVPSPSASIPLTVGDLDPCLELISGILINDLFGAPAEERESGENVAKIPESKSLQSYNTYEIVSQFLSPSLLPDLLSPLKEMLETRTTSRSCRIIEEALRRIALGVQQNHAFTPQALLIFIHSVISNSIPQLTSKPKSIQVTNNVGHKLRPPDSRLLPPEPGRSGPRPINHGNVGANIITEFGLQLFHVALKHSKFNTSDTEQLQMLDPFVALLTDSFSSPHVKVLSRTLHCLVWLIRLPLPSLNAHIDTISTHVFSLLRQYARAGMWVGHNRELVLSSFKAITVIVRDFKKHDVTEDELRILLSFVEEDIHDYQRQSTAFPLLKAILGRKLVVTEIYDIMHKVATLSVTSDSEHVRLQCRQAGLQFLLDYPLGKKLNRFLDFHLINLSYEGESGRESVLEQLNSLFTKFPKSMLNRHSTYFFVPLSARLLNEESPSCRQMVAACIKALLSKLDTTKSNEIAQIIKSWLQDNKLLHRRLGMQTLGLLVETESQHFIKHLPIFLPHIQQCLLPNGPGTTMEEVEEGKKEEEDSSNEDMQEEDCVLMETDKTDSKLSERIGEDKLKTGDHLLFTTLSTLSKILQECDVIRSPDFSSELKEIWICVHSLLLHPHAWVRLLSSRILGHLFAAFSPDEFVTKVGSEVVETCRQEGDGCGFKRGKGGKKVKDLLDSCVFQNSVLKVQELCHVSCVQLSSPLLNTELANQVVKNLVFLAKVLHRLQLFGKLNPTKRPSVECDETASTGTTDRLKAFKKGTVLRELVSESDSEEEVEVSAQVLKGVARGTVRGRKGRDLQWLIRRMSRLARYEAGHHPKDSIKRTHVLQWIAAISLDLGSSHLPNYLPFLLPPVHRELSDTSQTAGKELHTLAQEVVELLKGVCGKEAFSKGYAHVQKTAVAVRERRRKEAVLEAVVNPEKSLLRKRRKNELKKVSKRRRVFMLRPDGTAAAAAASRKRKRVYN